MDAVALHVTKNALIETGGLDDKTVVPLILGIWGGKGQGKTFQVELTLKKLGAEVVTMSAGEMEDEWAGVPGQRIRQRYKAAAELGRVRGKLSALVINDLDAGVGVFANTQRTVNNQIVIGTLMALCDEPNYVEVVADDWRTGERESFFLFFCFFLERGDAKERKDSTSTFFSSFLDTLRQQNTKT